MTTTTHRHRTRSGSPVSWGAPGTSLGDAPQFGAAGVIGGLGEKMTATILASADLGSGTLVFHDVVPAGGPGNIDHVVLRGDILVVIDTKRWKPGVFHSAAEASHRDVWNENAQAWERQVVDRDLVTRDGRDFEAGAAASLPFLTSKLVEELGWTGRVVSLLVVSSTSGNDADLDFGDFRLSHCLVTRSVELVSTLRHILERSRSKPVARWAYRLRQMTTSPNTIASPYPEALDGPLPFAPLVTADAPRFPMGVLVPVGLAAAVAVGHLLGLGSALGAWAGLLATAPGLVGAALMKVASDPVERANRSFGPWVAARYVVNRVLGVDRDTGPNSDKAELACVTVVVASVLVPVTTFVLLTLGKLPLLDPSSGLLRLLGLIMYGGSVLGLVAGPMILWSQYRTLERISEDWGRQWEGFGRDVIGLPPWAIPLLAISMGEQEESLVWFNHLGQSRSLAWRDFASEAIRQAART